MSVSPTDEVRASAVLHHHSTRGSMIALIVLQYRPHAMATTEAAPTLGAALMNQLKSAGWEDPVLMFRGGHLATSGRLTVTGATDDDPTSEITITDTADGIAYSGPITRDATWRAIAARAGSVGVLAGVDPAMDKPEVRDRLDQLAEQGKLLAARGDFRPNPGAKRRLRHAV